MSHETVFTLEATPIKFGPGRPRTRAGSSSGWASRGRWSSPTRDRGGRDHRARARRRSRRAGIDCEVFDRVAVEPTAESLQEAADFAVDGRFDGFVGLGGGLEPRHRQGRRPGRHPPRAGARLRQPAGRRRPQAARPAEAAAGGADHVGHRLGGDDGGGARLPRPARQGGDLAPLPAPAPGDRRPRAAAPRCPPQVTSSCGLDVVCHAVESFISAAYDHARARPRLARRPPALPGRQPGRRPVVGQGARVRRALPAPRGRTTATTSRRAAR